MPAGVGPRERDHSQPTRNRIRRDLKPQNIMWEHHTGLWVLIDFDLVARIGSTAVVGFTPADAAPEAVRAHRSAHQSMIVGPKLDARALGVVAMEVVLDAPPLGYTQDFNEVFYSMMNDSFRSASSSLLIPGFGIGRQRAALNSTCVLSFVIEAIALECSVLVLRCT